MLVCREGSGPYSALAFSRHIGLVQSVWLLSAHSYVSTGWPAGGACGLGTYRQGVSVVHPQILQTPSVGLGIPIGCASTPAQTRCIHSGGLVLDGHRI